MIYPHENKRQKKELFLYSEKLLFILQAIFNIKPEDSAFSSVLTRLNLLHFYRTMRAVADTDTATGAFAFIHLIISGIKE